MAKDSYVGDWVEILTGLAAGQVGLIAEYDADGILTFDSARGLSPMMPTIDGDRYRIVEQHPTRTVVLEIQDSLGPRTAEDLPKSTVDVTVDSDGGG